MLKNDDYKPLWDFSLRTDHETGARRMDLVVIDKSDKSCQIIDVEIPEDGRVREMRKMKSTKILRERSSKTVGCSLAYLGYYCYPQPEKTPA